ncbi:hypothetical protein FIBSPDRAFT_967185 [Athelia psychrophila]|uniref:Uncharacterized protein n=1 Tax=Athelia psychrophila TaxID=1759441 RepID=A0A167W067_9AGAM|nr:hypothetical protein FIBSPDRAFT_967185 [Fibularhizoctonia sp. CBS 109695]
MSCLIWYASINQCPQIKSYGRKSCSSVLQQHCISFDKVNDRVIWPLDTFNGFHQIGFDILLCRFVPQHSEDIFYNRPGIFAALHKGNRSAVDPFGLGAGVLKLFMARWAWDGALKKEEMHTIHDGSSFY